MLRRILLGAILALLAACGQLPQAASTPTPVSTSKWFYIDVEVVANSSTALQLAATTDYLAISQKLHLARISGQARPMAGSGYLIVEVSGLLLDTVPSTALYSLGQNSKGTSVPVEKRNGLLSVRVPIRGGDGRGRMRLALPMAPFAAAQSVGICITADFPVAYLPELNSGFRAGSDGTVCGQSGRVTKVIQNGETEILYLAVEE